MSISISSFVAWVGRFGSDPNKVAQVAHAEAGFISTYLFGAIGAAIILIPWGLTKEGYLDVKYEHAAFFWNGFVDLTFYAVGCIVAALARKLFKARPRR